MRVAEKFLPKPAYTVREITNLLNAFEDTIAAGRAPCKRTIWNRAKTRRFLVSRGVFPRGAGERCKAFVSFDQLRQLAPEIVDGLIDGESLEDAAAW